MRNRHLILLVSILLAIFLVAGCNSPYRPLTKGETDQVSAISKKITEAEGMEKGAKICAPKELAAAIYGAMDSITLRYRNVLTLRCFQELSYAEIAVTTGGTGLQARLLFFRAKRSLRQQLAVRGFRKKAQLLPALALFAALTSGPSRTAAAATLVEAATLKVGVSTFVLGMATTKAGMAVLVAAAVCIVGGMVGLGAFASHRNTPTAVPQRVETVDTTLLDLLRNPNFARPVEIGKSIVRSNDAAKSDNSGFLWADRSSAGPAQPGADLEELLLGKARGDLRIVIVPAGRGIEVRFQRRIVDGPGADIIVAGWSAPAPTIEVLVAGNQGAPLPNPTEQQDESGRTIWGYDLAGLPQVSAVTTIRIIGTHNQGPHQGFELHEIRARAR